MAIATLSFFGPSSDGPPFYSGKSDREDIIHLVNKGSYIILLRLGSRADLQVGKLGLKTFEAGWFAYVGSGMSGLDARVRRHLGKTGKKIHWHIDYLLERAKPETAYVTRSDKRMECTLAVALSESYPAPAAGFGSSDCRCDSHLFYLGKTRPRSLTGEKIRIAEVNLVMWECES